MDIGALLRSAEGVVEPTLPPEPASPRLADAPSPIAQPKPKSLEPKLKKPLSLSNPPLIAPKLPAPNPLLPRPTRNPEKLESPNAAPPRPLRTPPKPLNPRTGGNSGQRPLPLKKPPAPIAAPSLPPLPASLEQALGMPQADAVPPPPISLPSAISVPPPQVSAPVVNQHAPAAPIGPINFPSLPPPPPVIVAPPPLMVAVPVPMDPGTATSVPVSEPTGPKQLTSRPQPKPAPVPAPAPVVPAALKDATDAASTALKRMRAEIDTAIKAAEQLEDPEENRSLNAVKFRTLSRRLESSGSTNNVVVSSLLEAGNSGDSRMFTPVLRYVRDNNRSIRLAATTALGELGLPQALPALLTALTDSKDDIRVAAIRGLSKTNEPCVIPPMICLSLTGSAHRALIIEGIGKMEATDESVKVLTKCAKDDYDAFAAASLTCLAEHAPENPRVQKVVTKSLSHESPSVRMRAAEAVGRLGVKRSAEDLVKCLKDADPAVRRATAQSLGRLGHPGSVKPLLNRLKDDDEGVIRAAIRSLGQIGDRRAVAGLTAFATSESPSLQEATLEALATIGDESCLEPLLRLVESDDEDTALRAIASLRDLRDPRAIPALQAAAESSSRGVRRQAILALGKIKSKEVLPTIRKALADTDHEVRAMAARGLGALKDKKSVPSLENLLNDVAAVRVAAIAALGEIGKRSSIPALAYALTDAASDIRVHAIRSLVKVKAKNHLEQISALLNDSDPAVVRAAKRAVTELGSSGYLFKHKLKRAYVRITSLFMPETLFALLPSPRVAAAIAAVLIVGFFALKNSGLGGEPVKREDIQSIAFSTDGSEVVAVRTFGMLEVWNIDRGTVDRRLDRAQAVAAAYLDDGGIAYIKPNSLEVWSATEDLTLIQSESEDIAFTHLLRVGENLCLVDSAGGTTICDQSGEKVTSFQVPAGGVYAFTDDGTILAAASGGQLSLYSVETGEAVVNAPVGAHINGLDFNDANRLALATDDGLLLWSMSAPRSPKKVEGSQGRRLLAVEFSSNSGEILATSSDVEVWSEAGFVRSMASTDDSEELHAVMQSPDGQQLATSGRDESELWIYDVSSGSIANVLDTDER